MSRGIGEFDPIHEAVPEWMAVVFALVTQLGDIWFLALVLIVLFWYGVPSQADIATVGGVWLAGMGLYKGLKDVFGLPRPDEPLLDPGLLPPIVGPLYEATALASGYGFPSGHAVNTTIVYASLAYVLPWGTVRTRFGVAALLVVAVSFTRVALGVHYLVDVVAGVAVAVTLLAVAWVATHRITADRASVSLALAIPFGAFFLLVSGGDEDAIVVLSIALGVFAGWQLVVLGGHLRASEGPRVSLQPVAVRGGLAVAALAPLVAALEVAPIQSPLAAGAGIGLAATVAVALVVVRSTAVLTRVRLLFRRR